MVATKLVRGDEYVLNHCTKYLARDNVDERHSAYGIDVGSERARFAESWRFPIIDSHDGPETDAYEWNDVTFVWRINDADRPPGSVQVITTCHRLYEPLSLDRVRDTIYFALTIKVPKAARYRYLFVVDGQLVADPINPQTETAASGQVWSSFFTWAYNQPISFERWEFAILERLTRHILPFNSKEAQNFLGREGGGGNVGHLYRLDISVGVANYIDKVVAREERHRLYAYKTCLEMLDTVLRRREPQLPPEAMEERFYVSLYDDMASGAASLFEHGWDRARYADPADFLKLVRRHAVTGAFAHPKYGGNPAGIAWAYLTEHFKQDDGITTAFDWQRVQEKPLGTSTDYRG